ncbi:hypothetical protein CBM2587_B20119 [Cupriavidus taiwanensis]|uniref:Uncharacterized protein n=1 Tax=Cupriavidus taiwanensis TaxID=164546 RepID=A0A976A4V5_9BURK|nr:hypothetical protein CBM2587_B20119 [Cupriavidus taiwanensis]
MPRTFQLPLVYSLSRLRERVGVRAGSVNEVKAVAIATAGPLPPAPLPQAGQGSTALASETDFAVSSHRISP